MIRGGVGVKGQPFHCVYSEQARYEGRALVILSTTPILVHPPPAGMQPVQQHLLLTTSLSRCTCWTPSGAEDVHQIGMYRIYYQL